MSHQSGLSFSVGDVRIPATFHGTARLSDGAEAPAPPRPARHDDLPGRFEADLVIDFALLTSVGYVPVDETHPAWPLYLQARASQPQEPPTQPAPGISPHDPDAIVLPFETTVIITADRALQFGLVAPGAAGQDSDRTAAVRPVRPRPPPPLSILGAASPGRGRGQRKDGPDSPTGSPPEPNGDFDGFLDFMGDPSRYRGQG